MAKNVVVNSRGARIRMNDAALRIAEKHFGISRSRPVTKEIPIELLQLPKKVNIIKPAPPVIAAPAPEPIPIVKEAPVIAAAAPVETAPEVTKAEPKAAPKKKPTAKKK